MLFAWAKLWGVILNVTWLSAFAFIGKSTHNCRLISSPGSTEFPFGVRFPPLPFYRSEVPGPRGRKIQTFSGGEYPQTPLLLNGKIFLGKISVVRQPSPGPTTELYLPSRTCKLSSSMLLYAMKKYPYSSQTREPKECFVVKTREIATFYSPAVNKVRECMQMFSS
jgi:hypothetical protein